ncbi:MAG: LemA family protein [Planctomycetota bacterium]|nr:LemA family protein [Planctomycetota bacterium]
MTKRRHRRKGEAGGRSQTQAHDTRVARASARSTGAKRALARGGVAAILALLLAYEYPERGLPAVPPMIAFGFCGVVLVGAGGWRWRQARSQDEGHHGYQRAPSMPVRLVRDHDEPWVEGRVRCPQPLRPPEFRVSCCWLHLVVLERRGSGKNERWVKVRDEQHGTTMWITDAAREIEVDMRAATVEHPEVLKRAEGDTRTTLYYIRADGVASACGLARYRDEVVGAARAAERDEALDAWRAQHEQRLVAQQDGLASEDKGERLAAQGRAIRAKKAGRSVKTVPPEDAWHLRSLDDARDVPGAGRLALTKSARAALLVTPLPRHKWNDQAEAEELVLSVQGDIELCLGVLLLVAAGGVLCGLWTDLVWPGTGYGLLVTLFTLALASTLRLYNQFVAYRQRVRAARADLDADLSLRSALVPKLQVAVRAYASHEQHLQEHVAALRSGGDATAAVLALRESAPALAADANFRSLADDLTAVEEKIAFARAQLQDAAAEYNTLIQRFPASLVAWPTGFRAARQGLDQQDR